MADMTKYGKYWQKGTAANAEKLVDKYIEKAPQAVAKLKSPESKKAWKTNVSSAETEKRYNKSVDGINSQDMIDAMVDKGGAAYTRATNTPSALAKWEKNAAPYVDVAQTISKNKKSVITEQDAVDNFLALRRAMKKKKEELG